MSKNNMDILRNHAKKLFKNFCYIPKELADEEKYIKVLVKTMKTDIKKAKDNDWNHGDVIARNIVVPEDLILGTTYKNDDNNEILFLMSFYYNLALIDGLD